jgi:hypothetical protein
MRLVAMIGLVVIGMQNAVATATTPPESCAKGGTLWEQTERALDRGNGRVVDEQSYTVESIRADRVLSDTQRFWVERERQLQIERVQQTAVVEVKRERIVERESERLAAERERWIRMMNKPRHGEAAVVDRQEKNK